MEKWNRGFLAVIVLIASSTLAKDMLDPVKINVEGNNFGREGQYEAAIKKYSIAIKIDPSYNEPWYNRGKAKLNLKDYEGAIKDFSKALELYDDSVGKADVFNNRGIAYKKSGKVDKAIEDYRMALKYNPELNRVLLNLGLAFYEKGEVSKAREYLKRAQVRGVPEAAEALKQME